ncbi:hypothetical protein [Thauera sinica]|uniref:Uncharacterized protein n=1 Tax=Thauera sinica TaxID=2665146 RepID=A0ABW1AXF8_9RHOO|nr:hypothetical protein [Thauera sp. K11]ATE61236.1 hypothetical protein CCZ27_15945 [Thauera sp. K11]
MGYFATLAAGDRPAGAGVLTSLEALAADMEGVAEAALAADATRWANALPRAARLVGSKALAVGGGPFQAVLRAALAEGFAPPADTLVDTVSRLAETQRAERDLAVLLPGPGRLLADGTSVNDVKAALVGLMERICASRPAMVLLDEREDPALDGTACRRLAATARNVADYYGVALGLCLSQVDDPLAAIAARRALRLDHLLIADAAASHAECLAAASAAGWRSLGLAGPPAGVPAAEGDGAAPWFAMSGAQRDIEALQRALAGV